MINKSILLITLILTIQIGIAQNADQILKARGEVYFKFSLENTADFKTEVNKLGTIISIDKIEEPMVFAYANTTEFEKFSKTGFSYQVLTAPSMILSRDEVDSRGTTDDWDYYPNYSEYLAMMNQFALDYPSLCEVVNVGQSVEGRDILFIHINNNLGVDEAEPEFMYTSSMHGDEIAGYILMLRLIDYLLTNYGSDDRITNMVNSIDIWINPLANPDGTFAGGDNSVFGATRYNANYVNLNRNYPDPEDGPHPDGYDWQAETVVFMDFAESHDFTMSANFHGGAEVANYPWDTWPRLAADDDWWVYVCRQYVDTVHANSTPGYMTDLNNGITNGYAWYSISGGRQDYMNYEHHCRELTLEVSSSKLPSPALLPSLWEYSYRSLLNYIEQSLYGVRGLVTDANTGEALDAEIYIEGHDEDESQVYTHTTTGSYHRYLYAGEYSITYRSGGYGAVTINNIVVQNDNTTVVNVELDTLVGLDDGKELDNQTQVYPNPSNSFINVSLPQVAEEIRLTNQKGQILNKTKSENVDIQLDVSGFSKGIYFVDIQYKNHRSVKKILVY